MRDQPLKVSIEDEELVIRIGITMLAHGVEWDERLIEYDEKSGEYVHPRITDHELFAKAVLRELEEEEEDGTTPVHLLLDAAAEEAVDNGAEGIEIPGVYP